jgi:hypothetical protein
MAIATPVAGPAVKGNQPVSYPGSAGDVIYNRFTMSVPLNTAIGSCLEIGVIPPNCRVVDMVLENDALGASVTASVGVISDSRTPPAPPGSYSAADLAARTTGTEFFAAATALSAAAATRMSAATGFKVAPAPYERGIGITTAGATTTPVGNITLGVWLAAAA